MKIDKVNFKNRSAKFEFDKGKKGSDEKKLITESMDILTQKHTARDLMLDPTDKNVRKESKRYEKMKEKLKNGNLIEYTDLLSGGNGNDKEDDISSKNHITYSNICDMITAIHEHIRVLEESGIGFNSGSETDREKYTLLRNALNNLNEMRGQLTRTVKHPKGMFRKTKKVS